eukprot:Gb_09327 [translate_table: standard]
MYVRRRQFAHDISYVECYPYHKKGHYAQHCPKPNQKVRAFFIDLQTTAWWDLVSEVSDEECVYRVETDDDSGNETSSESNFKSDNVDGVQPGHMNQVISIGRIRERRYSQQKQNIYIHKIEFNNLSRVADNVEDSDTESQGNRFSTGSSETRVERWHQATIIDRHHDGRICPSSSSVSNNNYDPNDDQWMNHIEGGNEDDLANNEEDNAWDEMFDQTHDHRGCGGWLSD